jgi:hypothetical protein
MWVPDKERVGRLIRMIAKGEGGGRELLGSIQPTVEIAGGRILGCTEPVVLRLFFPSGGVSLQVPVFIIVPDLVRENTLLNP